MFHKHIHKCYDTQVLVSYDTQVLVSYDTQVLVSYDTQVLVSGKKSALPALVGPMETALAVLDSWFRANSL